MLSLKSSYKSPVVMRVLAVISFSHLLNDLIQSILLALYPLLRPEFNLSFIKIGMITLVFQISSSLLQPLIGHYTDNSPKPWSLPIGMGVSLLGLLVLAFAMSYTWLLIAASLIGIGSAVFHPESCRVARLASGERYAFAQSFFQVGGYIGNALGPLMVAIVVVPYGKHNVAWFVIAALLGIVLLSYISMWYSDHHVRMSKEEKLSVVNPLPKSSVVIGICVLLVLIFSKFVYISSLTNYYTFYLIHKFGITVQYAQFMLFLFLASSAVGTLIGGYIGDNFSKKTMIWSSILGAAPFSLAMPWVGLNMTCFLSIMIGLILSSAFSTIIVYAQELMPAHVGMVSGLFFGFAFGMGGIGAGILGILADYYDITTVYVVCGFLPLIGLMTIFLPDLDRPPATIRKHS